MFNIKLWGMGLLLVCSHSKLLQSSLDDILVEGVEKRVYPGVAAMVGDRNGVIYYENGIGMHKYPADMINPNDTGNNLPITLDTWFDLASCTKVIATTTAISLLYELGYISLNDKVTDLLLKEKEMNLGNELWSTFDSNGKGSITVLNCLLHNSGLTPDPVPYW